MCGSPDTNVFHMVQPLIHEYNIQYVQVSFFVSFKKKKRKNGRVLLSTVTIRRNQWEKKGNKKGRKKETERKEQK